jgi:hypothetical protein
MPDATIDAEVNVHHETSSLILSSLMQVNVHRETSSLILSSLMQVNFHHET